MKTNRELFNERRKRIEDAITLKNPDRTPVMAWIDSFAAVYKGIPMSKFSSKLLLQSNAILETVKDFPELDCPEGAFTPPKLVAASLFSKMKLAGKELPEGSLWQVDERETMRREDYDTILKIGWKKFRTEYYKRIDLSKFYQLKSIIAGIIAGKRFEKAGFPTFMSIVLNIPYDQLCVGRSFSNFTKDLYQIPDKVQAVMDTIYLSHLKEMKKQVKQAKAWAVFFGIARGASQFMSPKFWDRFVWPYIVKGVNAVIETGAYVNLHFDSNWDRDIERFKELPKGKCIWACDSTTDIFKLKEVLDGHMCIKGDVPPPLLSLGTPDEVYKYCVKLIKEIGPTGFILAPGCTLPMNAKVENVKAMLAAAVEN